jgi:ribonuclease-3
VSADPRDPDRADLESVLGHHFGDAALLEAALCHSSYSQEHDGTCGNERLEFLGDAVIDLVAAQLLFEAHEDWDEGHLTRARAALVNRRSLARCARTLDLQKHMRLGRGERDGGAEKERILANVFEAVVGALYLDAGIAPVVALARRLFAAALAPDSEAFAADPKTSLQECVHAQGRTTPRYTPVSDSGVENDERRFQVEVRVEGEVWGQGTGRTKRAAERAAAEDALRRVPPAHG